MEKRYDMICDSCGKLHCADDGTLRRDEYGSPLCSTCEDWILTAIEEPVVLATAYDSLTAEVDQLHRLRKVDLTELMDRLNKLTGARERIKALEEALRDIRSGLDSDPVQARGDYHTGLLCGVEDRNLQRDGYGGMDYGYERALERVDEAIGYLIDAALAGGRE